MAWGTPWAQRQGPPRIDLLPRKLVEQRLVRRQRTGIGAGFLVLLAVLGSGTCWRPVALGDAQDASGPGAGDGHRPPRPAGPAPAPGRPRGQIDAAEQLRASVYRNEIRFSGVMRDISAIVPDDVWLTSMAVAFNGTPGRVHNRDRHQTAAATGGRRAPATTPGSPGAGSPVASITFAGAGLEHVDVGGFLRALARGPKKGGQQVYLNPYFTTSQKTRRGAGRRR